MFWDRNRNNYPPPPPRPRPNYHNYNYNYSPEDDYGDYNYDNYGRERIYNNGGRAYRNPDRGIKRQRERLIQLALKLLLAFVVIGFGMAKIDDSTGLLVAVVHNVLEAVAGDVKLTVSLVLIISGVSCFFARYGMDKIIDFFLWGDFIIFCGCATEYNYNGGILGDMVAILFPGQIKAIIFAVLTIGAVWMAALKISKLKIPVPKNMDRLVFPPIGEGSKAAYTVPEIEESDEEPDRSPLEQLFFEHGLSVSVLDTITGDSLTRYEIRPTNGTKINSIERLLDDIDYVLGTDGALLTKDEKRLFIEVPHNNRRFPEWTSEINANNKPYLIPLGRNFYGNAVHVDITDLRHCFVAGTQGSGKSTFINTLIISLIHKHSPEDVNFIIIDPKVVDFTQYSGLPHLIGDVATSEGEALNMLEFAELEINQRKSAFQGIARNLKEYNRNSGKKLPYILIIIDEVADLVKGGDCSKEISAVIGTIAAIGRAFGVFLILGTQRPDGKLFGPDGGVTKNNVDTRIAFRLSGENDSKIVLGDTGAEKLLEKGDMLFRCNSSNLVRLQSFYVPDDKIMEEIRYAKNKYRNYEAEYNNAQTFSQNGERDNAQSFNQDDGPKQTNNFYRTKKRFENPKTAELIKYALENWDGEISSKRKIQSVEGFKNFDMATAIYNELILKRILIDGKIDTTTVSEYL